MIRQVQTTSVSRVRSSHGAKEKADQSSYVAIADSREGIALYLLSAKPKAGP